MVPAFLMVILLCVPIAAQGPGHGSWAQLSDLQKGEMYLLRKKTDQALQLFQKVWKQKPDSGYAVRGIVRAFHAKNQLAEARAYFEGSLNVSFHSDQVHYGLGFTFYLGEQYEEAEAALRKAIEINPQHALALNALGATLMAIKKLDEAVDKVKRAIQVNPVELMFYRNLKLIYEKQGRADAFRKEYDDLRSSGNLSAARNYGHVMAQAMRQASFRAYVDGDKATSIQKTLEMLQVYEEINHLPGVVAGHFSLGILYEENGEAENALAQFQEVLKINPNHIQARKKIEEYKGKNN